ncbi:MAG: hypothetical protein [Bacteriophage sp.]|nr:MAG: hypothetical protein [Bacteriophage sp.]
MKKFLSRLLVLFIIKKPTSLSYKISSSPFYLIQSKDVLDTFKKDVKK